MTNGSEPLIVTGATGFVGVNLVRAARADGLRVLLVDEGDRFGRLEAADIPPSDLIRADLTDSLPSASIPRGATIVHLAALAHVDYSMYFPEVVVRNNVLSTMNVLRVARERGCRLLFASSVEVYGATGAAAVEETAPLDPRSPYGASKVACEALVLNYLKCFGLDGSIVRFTNLYGPWQLPDRIVPRLTAQSVLGLSGEVDANRIRDFLFVDDAVAAVLAIIRAGLWGHEVFNVSSGVGVGTIAVADAVRSSSKGAARIATSGVRTADGRGSALVISRRRLCERTGWTPRVPFDEGMARTYAWYAEHVDWCRQFVPILRAGRSGPDFLADHMVRPRSGERT